MVGPIGERPISPTPPSDQSIIQLAKQLQEGIEKFNSNVEALMAQPSLADSPSHLEAIAQAIISLNDPAAKAARLGGVRMLRENLQDAGDIIHNILTQPLSIQGSEADIILLEAAKFFS